MPEHIPVIATAEEERAELEAVAEAFGHSSRLAQLLHFIGEKHFAGESEKLTEYAVATEVFGRSKTTFDGSEDAIARVEAHRLRKKLKDFYEGAGKNHAIRISIPAGSYDPVFTRVGAGSSNGSLGEPDNSSAGKSTHRAPAVISVQQAVHDRTDLDVIPGSHPQRNWILAGVALLLIATAWITIAFLRRSKPSVPVNSGAPVAAKSPSSPQNVVPAPAQVPVRLLAGYAGAPQTESGGQVWSADEFVTGGGPWRRSDTAIARTSDPFIFEYWRAGDSTYDIPLRPGVYELHLYFVSSNPSADSSQTFTVRINGNIVLTGFDINSDAMGENIADERVFRDVSPASDGRLHISFASESGAPHINAIEILPGTPHKQLPIRLVMQRASFTDHSGQFWHPDDYYMNGHLSDHGHEIDGSSDPELFSTERYGHFSYAIPVDTRDRYTLILHFVELYFGGQNGGGVGSRVFRVMCNGQTLLDDFDIYKEAGSLHPLTKTFYHLKPSAQGKLNITFEPVQNNATVSGIEVLDESQ
jgi:hypothetical protein